MVIIYGVRDYGRVDAHAGEHAQTKFFHIWYAPLFPVGSWWVTPTGGHSIKPNVKSIAAGYLRVWGPIAAVGLLSAGLGTRGSSVSASLACLVTAGVIAALSAWSWTWRSLRGAATQRRSDFNYVAFGSRCEPSRRFAGDRAELKRDLDRRWHERAPAQNPNEVAAYGAGDAGEAVLAYGLLRLSSIDRGKAGASDGSDADRILAGKHTQPTVEDGPYRAGVGTAADPKTAADLAALVSARAAQTTREIATTAVGRAYGLRRARRRSRLQLAGLIVLSLAAVGGTVAFINALRPTLAVTINELRSAHPPKRRVVELSCDALEPPRWEEYDRHGATTARIAMCKIGRYYVPVKLSGTGPFPAFKISGKLIEITGRELWVRQGLETEPELEAQTIDLYLDTTKDGDLVGGAIGLAIALGTPILWGLWFRARRCRKATERALPAT